MFKLPVCPHCRAVYHRKDVIRALKNRNNICHHCEKSFRASRFPGILILFAAALLLGVTINIALLSSMKYLNLWILFAATVVLLLLIYIFIPFFVSFIKTDDAENIKKQTKMKE